MNTPETDTPSTPAPAKPNARRKLIRGVFAVPALAAVHSGSALANSSSLRCLTNSPTGYAPAVAYPNSTETIKYVRTPLAVFRNDEGNYRFYVSGPVVYQAAASLSATSGKTIGVGGFISSSTYVRFEIGQNKTEGTGITLNPNNADAAGFVLVSNLEAHPAVPTNKRPSAALMFNAEGTQIVGVGSLTAANTHAATESCWTSFGRIL